MTLSTVPPEPLKTTRNAETVDELRAVALRVAQPREGYRYSLDPFLLADFARPAPGERVLDLGTGCGIIPLLFARQVAGCTIVGVERQPALAELASRNVTGNGLTGRVSIVEADILEIGKLWPANGFDLVVANPPYRRPGSGKVSPRAGRDLARHESSAGLADFLAVAKREVRPGGRICFIYHPERLAELFREAALLKLAPRRLRLVHGDTAAPARMFLVELLKGRRSSLEVLPPLFVYDGGGGYTREVRRIYGEGE